jgi:hypothetical protein
VARGNVLRVAMIAALVTAASLFVVVSAGAASVSTNVPCSAAALVAAVGFARSAAAESAERG